MEVQRSLHTLHTVTGTESAAAEVACMVDGTGCGMGGEREREERRKKRREKLRQRGAETERNSGPSTMRLSSGSLHTIVPTHTPTHCPPMPTFTRHRLGLKKGHTHTWTHNRHTGTETKTNTHTQKETQKYANRHTQRERESVTPLTHHITASEALKRRGKTPCGTPKTCR